MKQKTRKQTAAALVVTSAPLLYYGFSNFEAGASDPLEAIAISVACTGGVACFFGGIYMLFKKGRGVVLASQTKVGDPPISLALNETPEDFKDSSTNLRNTSHPLVSGGVVEKPLTPERVAEIKKNNQKALKEFADKVRNETKKNYATSVANAQKEIINKKQKVNEMATLTPAEKMNKLDELIEDDKALDKMKATNNKAQAEIRAEIKKDGFEQNKDGIWVPIKK